MVVQRRMFILLIALFIIQSVYYYSQLPDPLATNFDASGAANGWSSKTVFYVIYYLLIAVFAAAFLLLPRYLERLPGELVSVPNKGYWLAPERRDGTIAYIQHQMLIIGNATLAFLISIMQLVIEANVSGSYRVASGLMWILLGGYFIFTAVWTIRLITSFSKTP